jgi:hypothetical protein
MNVLHERLEGERMFTSAECRAQAEQKLAVADHDNRNRKRLIAAAEAWLFLASQLRRHEALFENEEEEEAPKTRHTARVKANGRRAVKR